MIGMIKFKKSIFSEVCKWPTEAEKSGDFMKQ